MNKRKLKRQLNLAQVVMLGTAGAIGAEIFVLTGFAAGLAGPAIVLALMFGGLISYSIALNYGELATSFPVTGGALTYVREAWGTNLLSFLVGSLDCLSSTFYAALSSVGFAYSLRVFLPALPVTPTAIGVILIFVVLNILGVANVGNAQVFLGGFLLLTLLTYILLGFLLPGGFDWNTFLPDGRWFIYPDTWTNFNQFFATIALMYVAYIGFEIIADDAEEVKEPNRNIPLGILISLTLCVILYPLVAMVTIGTIPWNEVGASTSALTDAAGRFLPGWGPFFLVIAGMIATLTTLNSAMLSATREAFSMSRYGMWPHALSKLGRFRTPYIAILVIGGIVCAVAAIGLVEFLSYISSSGYLFVLFWSNLALIRLRKRYPKQERPFRVPLFPLTVVFAIVTCFLVILFVDWRALLFGFGLMAVISLGYYLVPLTNKVLVTHNLIVEQSKDRILIPVSNPNTAEPLVQLAIILAQASEDTNICLFTVIPRSNGDARLLPRQLNKRLPTPLHSIMEKIAHDAFTRNVPLYTKICAAAGIAQAILEEIDTHRNVKLVLAGWPGPSSSAAHTEQPIKTLVQKANTNLAVLLPRNLGRIRQILVPIGGGVHSRLALRMAHAIAEQESAAITVLHTYAKGLETEEIEDNMLHLREIVEEEIGAVPERLTTRVTLAESVQQGIIQETQRKPYDLLILGASEEWGSGTLLFGSVDDWVIEQVGCSVLMVRHYEPVAVHWIRQKLKMIEHS